VEPSIIDEKLSADASDDADEVVGVASFGL
jgi:hypothetical protein